jgi:hypothetical protein
MNLPVLGTKEEPAVEEAKEPGEPEPEQEEKKPEPEPNDGLPASLADIIRDLTRR